MSFFRSLFITLLFSVSSVALLAADSESLATRTLKDITLRQKSLLADAAKSGEQLDTEAFRSQVENICHDYEALLRSNPNFAEGYADYGYLLSKVGMRKESIAILLKANSLDPDIPLVKNQIGNYLAEEGKPLEAVNYFLSAIKLEPKSSPSITTSWGRCFTKRATIFLRSGEWKREPLEHAMHEALQTGVRTRSGPF